MSPAHPSGTPMTPMTGGGAHSCVPLPPHPSRTKTESPVVPHSDSPSGTPSGPPIRGCRSNSDSILPFPLTAAAAAAAEAAAAAAHPHLCIVHTRYL